MNIKKISAITTNIFGSPKFSLILIAIFALQALWVAISFSWIIFDESYHFNVIKIYTDHLWPVIHNQPESYDVYRDFAAEGSKLYHFLMSFPLRVIELITTDTILQLKLLRVINIGMIVVGLAWFIKLFDYVKIKRLYTNLGLAVLIMLPIFTWVGGMVNYDNFIFMLTPLFLLYVLKIISKDTVRASDLLVLGTVGMVASLAKFTFLVVFVAGVVVVITKVVLLLKTKQTWKIIQVKGNRLTHVIVGGIFLIIGVLFIQTYAYNTVQYGTPRPNCTKTLSLERCMSNGVVERNQRLLKVNSDKSTESMSAYMFDFGKNVSKTLMYSSAYSRDTGKRAEQKPLFFIDIFYTVLGIILAFAIVAYLGRSNRRYSIGLYILLAVFLIYTLAMFAQGYSLYEKYNQLLAIQGRYLLLVLPIFFVLGFYYLGRISDKLKYKNEIIIGSIVLGLFMMTQGGGIITHIISAEKGWYWTGSQAESINLSIGEKLRPFVKETYDGN